MSYYNDLSFIPGHYTIESNGDLVLLADISERRLYSSRDPYVNHKGDGKIIKLDK